MVSGVTRTMGVADVIGLADVGAVVEVEGVAEVTSAGRGVAIVGAGAVDCAVEAIWASAARLSATLVQSAAVTMSLTLTLTGCCREMFINVSSPL